jgi:flagellar hook-associated protein 1 FlgK
MGLFGSLGVARSGLTAASELSTLISRNIANVNNPLATTKTANLVTVVGGNVRVESITNTTDPALFNKLLLATSDANAQQAIVDAVNLLDQTVADPQNNASPAALFGQFTNSLQQYQAMPQSITAAQSALSAAKELTVCLNNASAAVQSVRQNADAIMANDVTQLNSLLTKFGTANAAIVAGTLTGGDITDQIDQRNAALQQISEIVGVKSVKGDNNSLALYTDSGVTLFETAARTVSFQPAINLSDGISGSAVIIDGVPVTGAYATMPLQSGAMAGLAQVRDNLAVTYQNQLNEIARGLISVFAEKDQGAVPTLPDAPGLFTYATSGAAAVIPASGIVMPGLAATIMVNTAVDPAYGGDPTKLRDGGMNGAAYGYNATGAASFQGRLTQLITDVNTKQSFDQAATLGSPATLTEFSSSSVSWMEETRKTATNNSTYKTTLQQQTANALSSKTGVSLDAQMMLMLDVERSFQATSKLVTTINSMFDALLAAASLR